VKPKRFTVLDGGQALAESFDYATRRGDVIGSLLRAVHGRCGHHASKLGGKPMDPSQLRRERGRAFIEALVEAGTHGIGEDSKLLAAMGDLVNVLDADVQGWAVRRLNDILAHRGPRSSPVPMRDMAKLRRWLADRDAEDSGGPVLLPAGRGQTQANGVSGVVRSSARPSPSPGLSTSTGEGAAEGMPPSRVRQRGGSR